MENKLVELAKEIFERDDVTLDTKKAACEEWDSATHLILLSELEDELNIEVPIEEVGNIVCLRDFIKYVKE